jgi:hypothetical protein
LQSEFDPHPDLKIQLQSPNKSIIFRKKDKIVSLYFKIFIME